MRVVGPSGARAAREPSSSSLPPPSRRRHRRRWCLLAALHAVVALAATATLLLPGAAAADRAAGHDCPQHLRGGSILDLPDTTDCRRLMQRLVPCLPHHGQAVIGEAPSADCCDRAASFFSEQCHCWSSQFDAAAVMGVAATDDACVRHAALAALARAADDLTISGGDEEDDGEEGGGDAAAAAAAAGGEQPQQEQQAAAARDEAGPILLRTRMGGAASGGLRVFVGVLSAAARREARDAIRATWGQHEDAYRTRFFVARPTDDELFAQVRAEAVETRDLVVVGHITEHYLNISHQTLEVMRLAAADPLVTHVLKVDDDSYVHWERLTHRLRDLHSSNDRLFWGHMVKGDHPQRDPANQWYVSEEEWPADTYPPWAHGAGYVLSADLAAEVASGAAYAASTGGHLFKLEDVALASWLEWAAKAGGFSVRLVTDHRFNFEGCRPGDLVSHYIKPPQQRCMWAQQGQCHGC